MPAAMQLHAQLTKVDEAKRLVFGRIAEEAPDKSGELMDYASSKPYFERWSAEVAADTDGKSLGNVRAMHGKVAAGKLTAIDFNDAEKAVDVCAKVVDDAEWAKVLEGVYTGFSIGGSYVGAKKVEKMDDGREVKRYTAAPSEVSLVDRPCMPGARFFDVQKADGSLVKAEFAPAADEQPEQVEKAETPADDALDVQGTPEQVEALAALMKAQGLSLADVLTKLAPAPVEKTVEPGALRKSLYGCQSMVAVIGALADLKRSAEYEALYEGDPEDQAIAAEISAAMRVLASIVQRMLSHEVGEAEALEMAEKLGGLAKAEGADAAEDADPLLDLLKVGMRNSRSDAARIAKIHDLVVELGHACAPADKAEPAGDLSKADDAALLEKAEALAAERVAPIQKLLDDAVSRIAKLEAQPAVPTIRLRAVEKAQDIAAPEPEQTAVAPVRDDMGKEQDAATLIKSLHASGGRRIA